MLYMQKLLFKSHLAEEEKIIFIVHKHWIEILKTSLQFVFFGLVFPWGLWLVFSNLFWICLIWSLIVYLIFLYEIADWFFDAWLITNLSIINVEWKGIFHRLSSRIDFSDIKEISYEIKGFWGIILKYGQMIVYTNVGTEVILNNTKNPKKIELLIHQVRENFINQQKLQDSDTLQEILADIVKNHLAKKGL